MGDNEPKVYNGRYFKNNSVLRVVRFFNLLEPENNVLSISKTFMWISIFMIVYVTIWMPTNLEIIIPAFGSILTSSANYSYRRWIQYKKIKKGDPIENDTPPLDDAS